MKTKKITGKKDYESCPYCQAERDGYSTGWGFSSEGWEAVKKIHEREHIK